MSIKGLATLVTSKAGRQVLQLQKHSPRILFVAGVVGVVATVVIACHATTKLHDVLDETTEEIDIIANDADSDGSQDSSDTKKKVALVYAKTGLKLARLYGPAVIVGAASIAALTGSHHIMNQRYAGSLAAYAALDEGFKKYRARVKEKLGDEADREFKFGYTEKEVVVETDEGPKIEVIRQAATDKPSTYAVRFDSTNPNWNKEQAYNHVFLRGQEAYLNNLLQARGHVFLFEVYDALNLPRTPASMQVGWIKDGEGDNYIDFGIFDSETEEVIAFMNGHADGVWVDPNVDGLMFHMI